MKASSGVIVGSGVLLALLWWLSEQRPQTLPESAAPAAPGVRVPKFETAVASMLPASSPDAQGAVAGSVRRALDLRSALIRLRQERDPADPLLLSLVEEVRIACALIKRPDTAFAAVEDDPNRSRWREQLAARCSGVDAGDLAEANWPRATWIAWEARMPSAIAREQGPAAGVAAAHAAIAQSPETRVLADALRFLVKSDALPLEEIFAATEVPTRIDLEAIALTAADWIACERAAACDTTALATLNHCTQFGCPVGSDLQRALMRSLPRMHFEAARRLVLWALRSP